MDAVTGLTGNAQLRARRLVAVATVVALSVAWLPTPAEAQTVSSSNRERVLGGTTHERVTVRHTNGATARGDLLRWKETDSDVRFATRLGQGTISGVERFDPMQRRETEQRFAIAGTNGGYFAPGSRPFGAPNGLHVQGGRLHQTNAVRPSGLLASGRADVGVRPDGRLLMDRIEVRVALRLPATTGDEPTLFDEVNRAPVSGRDEGLLLYDERYGRRIDVAAGRTVLTVSGLRIGTSGTAFGTVDNVRIPSTATSYSIPAGRHLIVGDTRGALDGVRIGHEVRVSPRVRTEGTPIADWAELSSGAAGGQLLIRGGSVIPTSQHGQPSSFSDAHVTARRARTAVGRTADGTNLLLTIDESDSAGVSVPELARVMRSLGAVDAVNMDGGGSTSMSVAGRIVNRVSDPARSHSTGLFLYAPAPPSPRQLSAACDGAPRSGFRDIQGSVHETAIHCLSWWNIAQGRDSRTFDPGGTVTRAQMATFLANLADAASSNGSGRALPNTSSHPFDDVRGSVHERAIARLHAAGVINGTSRTTYAPSAPVTRAQAAALLDRAVEYVTRQRLPAGRDTFLDDNGSPHESSIDRLARAGVITGTGGLQFAPQRSVRRDAMASLLMRAADRLVEDGVARTPRGSSSSTSGFESTDTSPLDGVGDLLDGAVDPLLDDVVDPLRDALPDTPADGLLDDVIDPLRGE